MPRIYAVMGSVLRDARERAGRTQEDVAKAVSLTRTSLTNIEKGRQKLLLNTFADIATFLGKVPSQLLAEVEAKIAAQRPDLVIPAHLSRRTHEQISGMLDGLLKDNNHAKPSSKHHPRKSRIVAK